MQSRSMSKEDRFRILVTAHSFIEKSGVDVYTENLFFNLARIDDRIEYIFVVNRVSKNHFTNSPSNVKLVYPSRMLDSPLGKILWYAFFVGSFIKKYRIDLVFNNSATGNFVLTNEVPIVSCLHDLGEFHLANKYSFWRMIYRKYVCLPINKIVTRAFISVSSNTKKDMIDYLHIESSRITVIANGADHLLETDHDNFTPSDSYSSRYLLYVGRLDPFGKNVLTLLEGFKIVSDKHDDVNLYLVGHTSRGSELVRKKIEELSISHRVRLFGYVENSTLTKLYKEACLFVFPSLYEGFGFPILEAMKFGTPVVCSNTSSLPEVGCDAAIYFDPRSASSIAEKIELVIENAALRDDLKSRGKHRYGIYTWEKCAKKTYNLLQKYLNDSSNLHLRLKNSSGV